MPPKPFKPPRPSSSSANRGRPKGSTKSTRKSTSNDTPSTGIKSKPGSKGTRTSTSTSKPRTKPRISAASLDLPGISSDSDVAENTDEEEDDDPFDLSLPSRKNRDADTYMDLTQEGEDEFEEREEKIPGELLTRLLHEFFKEDGTRISKDANKAIGRYMETFVREALARAAYMSEQGEERGMLEVEDLEKLAPQLLLDF